MNHEKEQQRRAAEALLFEAFLYAVIFFIGSWVLWWAR